MATNGRDVETDAVRDRLLKVLRLAQQGIGGERTNAEVLLDKLCRKFRITREQLENADEPRTTHWFRFKDKPELELLHGIVGAVVGRTAGVWRDRARRNVFGVDATPAEAIQIGLMLEVYAPALRKALLEVQIAFGVRHRLYDATPDDADGKEAKSLSPAERYRMMQLVNSLEHIERPVRRIGSAS